MAFVAVVNADHLESVVTADHMMRVMNADHIGVVNADILERLVTDLI